MKLLPFCAFTILGAGAWNAFLAWCGFALKSNWSTVMRYSHWIDIGVVVLLVALLGLYIGRHLRRRGRAPSA
jgi:membrane protein DedA with SNARE-associated domain